MCILHVGLSAPVPRGRKGKNKKKEGKPETSSELVKYNKMKNCDPEVVLRDPGYRKHLHRHANKWDPHQFNSVIFCNSVFH